MTGPQRTLIIILAFVALVLGSFIWFIATWDSDREEPVASIPPAFLFAKNMPGSGAAPRNSAASVPPEQLS